MRSLKENTLNYIISQLQEVLSYLHINIMSSMIIFIIPFMVKFSELLISQVMSVEKYLIHSKKANKVFSEVVEAWIHFNLLLFLLLKHTWQAKQCLEQTRTLINLECSFFCFIKFWGTFEVWIIWFVGNFNFLLTPQMLTLIL